MIDLPTSWLYSQIGSMNSFLGPVPFAPNLEDAYMPSAEKIEAAVRKTL